MPEFLSNVRFKKGLRGNGWATAEYYGAKGDNTHTVNDQPALQSAISDLNVNGGGRLYLAAVDYRLDSSLTIPPTVSLVGCPSGGTRLLMNHATASMFTPLVGSNYTLPTTISDINFGAIGSNSGVVFNFIGVATQRWLIKRCSFNAPDAYPFLQGTFFTDDGASSNNEVTFEDCYAGVLGGGPAFQMNKSGCRTNFIRGTYAMPATYNADLFGFYGGGGLVDGVSFDLNAHSTGSPNCVFANTVSDTDILIINNTRTFKSSGLIGNRIFLKVNDGAYVRTSNLFTRGCTRYLTSGLMGITSALEPEPHYSDIPGTLTYNIRNHYSNVALWLTNSGNPSINMPATGMYLGQKMTVSVTNISGSTIGGYLFGNVSGYAPTSIPNGRTVTFTAEFSSNSVGNGHWMITGTPLAPYVA
jgi:hypothetical protein